MSVEIRVCPPDRFTDLLRVAEVGFSEDVPDDVIERVKAVSDPERFVCAMDGDRIAGQSLNQACSGDDPDMGWVSGLHGV